MGKTMENIIMASGFVSASAGLATALYYTYKGESPYYESVGISVASTGCFLTIAGVGLRYFREYCEKEDSKNDRSHFK